MNDPQGWGWVGRLVNDIRLKGADPTIYNLGVRRHSSRDIAARWQEEAARRALGGEPPRLFFALGAVDAGLDDTVNVPPDESLVRTRAILEGAKAAHLVLMAGPPPMLDEAFNARVAELSAAQEALCAELGVPYLNVFQALDSSSFYKADLKGSDGVHPGATGYAEIFALARDWAPWLAWFSEP